MMGYIYIHTNKVNGKKYIGQTVREPSKRWKNGEGYKGQLFYRAIQKYGWDNFEHEVVEVCSYMMDFMESHLISLYNTTSKDFGYNLDSGGSINKKHSEETKKKMSEAKKGRPQSEEAKRKNAEAQRKRRHSEETKRKISKSNKGRVFSEEHRKKLSESMKGKKRKPFSEETKRKMSEAKKRNHTRCIYNYTIEHPNGEITITDNLKAFCREYGICYPPMSHWGHTKGYKVLSKTIKSNL